MGTVLFALFTGPISAWGIADFVIAIIILAGVIIIGVIALKAMGYTPPPWAVQIFWVVIIVLVAIFAIRLVMNM